MKRLLVLLLALAGAANLLPSCAANPLLGLLGGGSDGNNGGLLGSLLDRLLGGGQGGLLGGLGLNGIIQALLCLIEHLGLGVVLDLLQGLGLNTVLGLSEIACEEGGDQLLDILFPEEGPLSQDIVDQVLCLRDVFRLEKVIKLVDRLGLDKVLGLYEIVCPDGVPLIEFNSTTTDLLGGLLDSIGLNGVLGFGMDGILELSGSLRNGTDVEGLLRNILCLVECVGLKAVTDLVNKLGVDEIHHLSEFVCTDSGPLFTEGHVLLGFLISEEGLLRFDILYQVLCLVKALKLEIVSKLLTTDLGMEEVLGLYEIFCPGGVPLLELNSTTSSVLASIGLDNAFGLLNITEQLSCLIKEFHLKLVIRLLRDLGLTELMKFQQIVCPNDIPIPEFSSMAPDEKDIIANLTATIGADQVDALVTQYGLNTVTQIARAVTVDGYIHGDLLVDLLCIIRALGAETVLELVDSASLPAVLNTSVTVCPAGNPLSLGPSVDTEVLGHLLVLCQNGGTVCSSAMSEAVANYGCTSVCPTCANLQTGQGRTECESRCRSNCSWTFGTGFA